MPCYVGQIRSYQSTWTAAILRQLYYGTPTVSAGRKHEGTGADTLLSLDTGTHSKTDVAGRAGQSEPLRSNAAFCLASTEGFSLTPPLSVVSRKCITLSGDMYDGLVRCPKRRTCAINASPLTAHYSGSTAHTLVICVHHLFKLVHDLLLDHLVEHVHLCLGELSRVDAALEQHVQLGKGAAARLRNAEEGVNDAAEADPSLLATQLLATYAYAWTKKNATYPEEASEVTPVPLGRIQHVWGQDAGDDGDDEAS